MAGEDPLNLKSDWWDDKLAPQLQSTYNLQTGQMSLIFEMSEESSMGKITPGEEVGFYWVAYNIETGDNYESIEVIRWSRENEFEI